MNGEERFQSSALSLVALYLCTAVATGCGGATPPPEAPPAASAAPAAQASATAEAPPPEAVTSEPAAEKAGPPESEPAASAAPPPGGKNISYRMAPGGLVVELDGVQLEPRAEPIKLGGGWGVKLTVKAKAIDDREHRLQSPSKGPLMIAEEIDRGGKKELVPDERQGDGEITLEKTSTPIERELRKPIVAGQTLTLYVGLWGLGTDANDRKPIKKLFVVKMVAGTHTPQPVVSAPE